MSNNKKGPGLEKTREVVEGWLYTLDAEKYMAEDVILIDMATGKPWATNRQELADNVYWLYHIAFDAEIVDPNIIIGNGKAAIEFMVIGKHIGEFAGIPGTGRKVEFPRIVTFKLEEEPPYRIKSARSYIMMNILMEQISSD